MLFHKEIKIIKKILKKELKWCDAKIAGWLFTDNPLLGNVSPMVMVRTGRLDKLMQFIEFQIAQASHAHNPQSPETPKE